MTGLGAWFDALEARSMMPAFAHWFVLPISTTRATIWPSPVNG